jgi:ABC-2 type transport system permease protein
MDKILAVAINDLRINFRDRSTFIFLVLMPAFMVIVIAFANGAFATPVTERPKVLVDVINHDDSALSTEFLTTIRRMDETLVLCPMDNDADDMCKLSGSALNAEQAAERIESNTTRAALEIPAGFGESLLNDQPVNVSYRSKEAANEASAVFGTIQAAASRVSGAIIARRVGAVVGAGSLQADAAFAQVVYERAADIWETNPVSVNFVEAPVDEMSEEAIRARPGFRQSVPGMGSMYVLFTVLAGVSILINERKNWTLQRMLTMPVSGGQVIAGKMLARFVMGMLQYAIAFGVGLFFAMQLGFNFGNSPLALIAIMAAFTFCGCALTLLLATMVQNDSQAGSVTTLVALTLAPIGGAWWSLEFEFIPEFMRTISYLSPIRYAMDGFSKVIYNNAGVIDVLPQVAVLLAAGIVLFAIAARRFKYV